MSKKQTTNDSGNVNKGNNTKPERNTGITIHGRTIPKPPKSNPTTKKND